MQIEGNRCPLCLGTHVKAFVAIAHDMPADAALLPIKECGDCGLAWQFPRHRSADESVDVHTRCYEAHEPGGYYDPERRRAIVATELAFVESLFDRPMRLLDIGAGDGAFIAQAAARGWRCIGVDPAARLDPALRASGPGSFDLVRGTLADLDPDARYDAITLWDVIEHLDDPEPVLADAVRLLAPDGVLIIETGNYQSADRISAGADWWGYAADHRWYFAPGNVRRLLERAGIPHAGLWPRVLRPWWKGSHDYRGPSRLRTLKQVVRRPTRCIRALGEFRQLRAAASRWRTWAGLGIFAIASSRAPIRARAGAAALIDLGA